MLNSIYAIISVITTLSNAFSRLHTLKPGQEITCNQPAQEEMNKKALKFFNLRGVSILDQLCFEELMLRTTADNCVVVNTDIAKDSIVLGFSGKPLELLNIQKVKKDNLQVIRRFTGGGTVVVDHSTVFASFVLNAGDVESQPYPREIMKWTEEAVYAPAFADLAETKGAETEQFSLMENDYVWGDRKIGGNAQTITKNRWVHHTSFLWKFDPLRMGYLKLPSKRPAYRADRPHLDFLTEISTHLPAHRRDPTEFAKALHRQMASLFQLENGLTGVKCGDQLPEAMLNEEFQELHARLKLENPSFVPRTYIVDDLPDEPATTA